MLKKCRIGIRELAQSLNISDESTQPILDNVFSMMRVNAKLVPKDLMFLQKRRRVEVVKQIIANVAQDPTLIQRSTVQ